MYVANAGHIGGGNRVLMDIVTGLDPARHVAHIIAPVRGALTEWAAASGLSWAVVHGSEHGRIDTYRRAFRLRREMVRRDVRIVHAMAETCFRAAGLAASWTGARRICHLGFPPTPEGLRWGLRWRPDVVVGCYDGQARDVAPIVGQLHPSCLCIGIPNCVDTSLFVPPSESKPADPRWRFGADHVALIVGHLSEVKGYSTFLRAAASVARSVPSTAFVALGGESTDHGALQRYEQLARELGIADRVHFLGRRDDVAPIVRSCDVMVLPSRDEGLPLAILEALGCGRPVIATPVGGVPEAVTDEVGILVRPDDPEALAAALTSLFLDPARHAAMSSAARQRAETQFSVARFHDAIHRLYDSLVAAPS
jgi:glycosyltransferase involved in cell wall biosynthesis